VKVLLQRVSRAAVRVDGESVGEVQRGFLALVGVERGDRLDDADFFADKTVELRVFPDEAGKMNRSVLEAAGSVLVVSQFTLAGSTRRGRRPSFDAAASPEIAEPICRRYAQRIAERGVPVATGVFRAFMEVELVNDGPVTIMLDPPAGRGGA
jgi:D-tyrosyl-tRNA(Tyr) deacylase